MKNKNISIKILIGLAITMLISLALSATLISIGDQTPVIWTDKNDYKPEETVVIYGSGFLGDTAIYITVIRPDNAKDSWITISSSNGNFTTTYQLDGITGLYLVEATDNVRSASTTFTDTADWTTELWGWDRVSNSWVSGNLAGYPEGDLVGFKFVITNNQNVAAVPPQINSFYDYFNAGVNAVGIDAEVLWQYNYGSRNAIDFTTRYPPLSYITISPDISNQFYKYQGGVRQNYYQFNAGKFPALQPKETLIIYFQAHLAETAYWKTVTDPIDPDLDPTKKPDPVPGPHYGAAYFPGASLQVGLALVYTGTKTETQSIPVSYAPGAISGYKFNDLDADGINMEAGEPGLANWTIILDGYDMVGHHIMLQTNTTSNGSYIFPELPLGIYNITEVSKAGWIQSYPPTIIYYNVAITEGNRVITGKNFGNYQPGKISGFKFNDLNGDGVWSAGEPALEGWNITLTGPINTWILTNGSGYYEFTNLPPGVYTVSEELPTEWIQTAPASGVYSVNIESGSIIQNLNFGNFKLVNITVLKYEDITGDGYSIEDVPIVGWNITLYKNGVPVSTVSTGIYGNYTWTNLGPGSYEVEESIPAGWINTSATSHVFGAVHSGDTYTFTFTNFKLGVKGGYKYEDKTGNGPSADDTPLAGWIISLYKWNGTMFEQINSTLTNMSGYYEFTGLTAGLYRVYEVLPADWTQMYPSLGYYEFNVTSGFAERDNNFYNFHNVNITICKYEDITGNGKTGDDTPIQGWSVMLYKNGVLFSNVTTGVDGCYTWTNLGPGNYSVSEIMEAGWINTSATSYNFGTVVSGGNYSFTFTNFKLGKISGYKWNDLSKDGVWDATEPPLSGWTIYLYSGTTLVASRVTDTNGYYEFTGLVAGNYTVSEALQVGWQQTYPPAPGTHSIIVVSSSNIMNVNFGNKEITRFLKEFTGIGALNNYMVPTILDPVTAQVFQIKTGPAIWFEITYTVINEDAEGHYYILWDKWGGNLLVLNATPASFNAISKTLTVNGGISFKIDYNGYSAYLGSGLVLSPSKGNAIATLHTGDQQQGTNPGKGKGTSNDGKAYDVDIRWEVGWLNPGESATLVIYVAPGMNSSGQLQFSSWGTYVINTGPRVRAYSGLSYDNNEFLYSWSFTNQLTVIVQQAI